MIIVLHGEDTESSYKKLSEILSLQKDSIKVSFKAKTPIEQINQALQTQDLLGTPKLIIVENFLSPLKKLPENFLKSVPKESTLVFWENKTLSPAKVTKLSKLSKLEYFKKTTEIFSFLDNLAPGSKIALEILPRLKGEDGLLWQIQNRLLLLSLCKLEIDISQVAQITKRQMAPWQWEKIKNQAQKFDLSTLLASFSASLKMDHLIKSGKTTLNQEILISIFLLKYLR